MVGFLKIGKKNMNIKMRGCVCPWGGQGKIYLKIIDYQHDAGDVPIGGTQRIYF